MQAGSFEICAEFGFTARHALRTYRGANESPHAHNFRVRIVLAVSGLDEDGIGYDFVALKAIVDCVVARFDGQDLNKVPPFDRINPTAEHLALEICCIVEREIAGRAGDAESGTARVKMIEVGEADGMSARYYPAERMA